VSEKASFLETTGKGSVLEVTGAYEEAVDDSADVKSDELSD